MNMQRKTGLIVISGIMLATKLIAGEPPVNADADNTKKNQIHDGKTAVSADQQSNNKSDTALTRRIRQALIAEKSLSTYAHNVKIITKNGLVVLKGPVKDSKEKEFVESQASQIAGADKVHSEIEVSN